MNNLKSSINLKSSVPPETEAAHPVVDEDVTATILAHDLPLFCALSFATNAQLYIRLNWIHYCGFSNKLEHFHSLRSFKLMNSSGEVLTVPIGSAIVVCYDCQKNPDEIIVRVSKDLNGVLSISR